MSGVPGPTPVARSRTGAGSRADLGSALRRLRRLVRATVHAYAPGLIDRFPRIRVQTGVWVPGWVLRLATAGLAAACLQLLRPANEFWVLFAFALVALVLMPGRMLPSLVAAAIGLLVSVSTPSAEIGRTAWLILGLPAMALLGALAGQVGWRARIEVAAIVPALRRLAVVQVVAQPIGLLACVVGGAPLEIPLLPVLAALALGVLVLVWAPHLRELED